MLSVSVQFQKGPRDRWHEEVDDPAVGQSANGKYSSAIHSAFGRAGDGDWTVDEPFGQPIGPSVSAAVDLSEVRRRDVYSNAANADRAVGGGE